MKYKASHGYGLILLTFLLALMLTVIPLPQWAAAFRPEWIAMVLIYWCMALPERVGVGTAWLIGLLLDVLTGALLGQHALALALVAFLTLKLYQRIRVFPLWQQALSILVLVAMQQMVSLWVKGVIGLAPDNWTYWMPSFTSMLLWPWLFIILRDFRRRFSIN